MGKLFYFTNLTKKIETSRSPLVFRTVKRKWRHDLGGENRKNKI